MIFNINPTSIDFDTHLRGIGTVLCTMYNNEENMETLIQWTSENNAKNYPLKL